MIEHILCIEVLSTHWRYILCFGFNLVSSVMNWFWFLQERGRRSLIDEDMSKRMEVCETCGALLVAGDAQQRIDEHIMGKQHMGYARIRAYVEERRVSPAQCTYHRADSRFAPSQWETALLCNVSLAACKPGISPVSYIDGLVQERRKSSALAMELRLSCTNPSIY